MNGLILAAGTGRRLRPHTDRLPKALVPVDGATTILDLILRNLAAVDITAVTIVVGHASEVLVERAPELAVRHGVRITLRHNDRPHWNNAYSLWLARDVFAGGSLLVNGDTLHPVDVEKTLLAQRGPKLLLAVDVLNELTDEAMKVRVEAGRLTRITKRMTVESASGEYLGAALIEPEVSAELAAALELTWQGDPQRFYEDGFQALADAGEDVRIAHMGAFDWVEVDNHADLARARDIACRY